MELLNKIKNSIIYSTAFLRKSKLINPNITIISNNCWGGMVSKSFGLRYNSPTAGLFIMSDDYIIFLSDLENYLKEKLVFIDPKDSKYRENFRKKRIEVNYPVGLLKDIEIFFVHYVSEEEAKEKWERRTKRVDLNNLLIKISEQNDFTSKTLEDFSKLKYDKKIAFVGSDYKGKEVYRVAKFKKNEDKDLDINAEPRTTKAIIDLINR